MRKSAGRLLKGIILVLSIAMALLIAEASLRFFGYRPKPLTWRWTVDADSVSALDSRRIWADRPSAQSSAPGLEGTGFAFRANPEDPLPFASERFRIFMVGDSYVYGDAVGDNETVPFYLQRILRENGYDVTVINAGVRGYSPGQEYLFLKDIILKKLRPSMILWMINPNDRWDMRFRSLHFVFKEKLVRIPGWTNGVFLQGLVQRATPAVLRGSYLMRFFISSLENVDLVRWFQRPSDTDSARKIGLMVDDVVRSRVPVSIVLTMSLVDWNGPELKEFAAEFNQRVRPYLNMNDVINARWSGKLAEEAQSVQESPDRLFLTARQDALQHPTAYGNRITAEAIFDYLVKQGATNGFPRMAVKRSGSSTPKG